MLPATDTPNTVLDRALTAMAAGRVLLGIASLTVPQQFARAVGVAGPTPELSYMTRIYGARAVAMGTAYLTGAQPERHRWTRLSLAVDTSDTITGLTHLVRRDSSPRAIGSMVALTGVYALLGARHVRRRSAASPR